MEEVLKQLKSLNKKMGGISEEVKQVNSKLTKIESTLISYAKQIEEVQKAQRQVVTAQQDLQVQIRKNNIEISGFPEKVNEDLYSIIC